MTRGYKIDTIDNAFGKATQHTQKQLLYNDKANKTETRPTFRVPFNTNTTHIGQILKKHWHLIESEPTLKILLPNIAYKHNKNINSLSLISPSCALELGTG
jgi:regulator of sigma D